MGRKEKETLLKGSSSTHKKKRSSSSQSRKSHRHRHTNHHAIDPQMLAVAIVSTIQYIQKDRKGKGREIPIHDLTRHQKKWSESHSPSSGRLSDENTDESNHSSRSSSRSSRSRSTTRSHSRNRSRSITSDPSSHSSSSNHSVAATLGKSDRNYLRVSNNLSYICIHTNCPTSYQLYYRMKSKYSLIVESYPTWLSIQRIPGKIRKKRCAENSSLPLSKNFHDTRSISGMLKEY